MERRIFNSLAAILEYPCPGLAEAVRECETLISPADPQVTVQLRRFRSFVEETPLGRLQEIYTGTFDLDAACYPYVGYHLFGESYKRSVFLLELKERYRAHSFTDSSELPDHTAVLLRFLGICDDAGLTEEIVRDALLPALERMTRKAKSAGYDEEVPEPEDHRGQNPYREILQALRRLLEQQLEPARTFGLGAD